jgi:glycosyltransferase involved in cell wall biosynthesis
VQDYVDRATLCVFPSLSENFPLVGLEAMARGKAVIASQRGFSEYIDHMKNGYLLESTDPDTVKLAILRLLNDDKLRSKLAQCGRLTAENFRPDKVIQQYIDLYAEALGRKDSSSTP